MMFLVVEVTNSKNSKADEQKVAGRESNRSQDRQRIADKRVDGCNQLESKRWFSNMLRLICSKPQV